MDTIITNSLIIMLILVLLVTIATLLRRNKTIIELKKQTFLDEDMMDFYRVTTIPNLKAESVRYQYLAERAHTLTKSLMYGVYYSKSDDRLFTLTDEDIVCIGEL